MNKDNLISKSDFLACLEKSYSTDELLREGILQSGDLESTEDILTRRDMARITYGLLTKKYREADEEDWSAALDLKDLYECHTCVKNIAQVYAKGIMQAKKEGLFASKEGLLIGEVQDILKRLQDKTIRLTPKRRKVRLESCSLAEIERIKRELPKNDYAIIDVRDEQSYKASPIIAGSRNIPLIKLNQNPYGVSSDTNMPVYLVCEYGYKSAVAAQILLRHGYRNITVCSAF